jgi:hypothetical protein
MKKVPSVGDRAIAIAHARKATLTRTTSSHVAMALAVAVEWAHGEMSRQKEMATVELGDGETAIGKEIVTATATATAKIGIETEIESGLEGIRCKTRSMKSRSG